jgi:LysM repeat protein
LKSRSTDGRKGPTDEPLFGREPMIDELDDKFKDLRDNDIYVPPDNKPSKSPKRFLLIAGGALIALFFVLALFSFFFGRGPGGTGEQDLIRNKVTKMEGEVARLKAMEERVINLEKNIALQSVPATGAEGALAEKLETLSRRVEALEKKSASAEKPAAAKVKEKPKKETAASAKKRYHDVKKGETLYQISKKYGISLTDLRNLNNLNAEQSIQPGQKLQVSK